MATGDGSLAMSLLVVLLVLRHYSLSTLSTMLVLVLPTTLSRPRVVDNVNSTVLLMCIRRHLHLMALPASTVVSFPQLLVSLSTVVSTLVSMIPSVCFYNFH